MFNEALYGRLVKEFKPGGPLKWFLLFLFGAIGAPILIYLEVEVFNSVHYILIFAVIAGVASLPVAIFQTLRYPFIRSHRIYMGEKGLSFVKGGQEKNVLWDQVIGYQKNGGSLKVQCTDGSTLKIPASYSDDFMDVLRSVALPYVIRNVVHRIGTGEEVSFGKKLSLNREGVKVGKKLLSWMEVGGVRPGNRQGQIAVFRADNQRNWKTVNVKQIENLDALLGSVVVITGKRLWETGWQMG